MQTSERRKKILDILFENGSLSYTEILDEITRLGEDAVEVLCDLDNLVFFKFLQNIKTHGKSKLTPETKLKLMPKTEEQMRNDPSRILTRINRLEREVPSWYKKLAILNVLTEEKKGPDEIMQIVQKQSPRVRWQSSLIKASLRILKKGKYISTTGKGEPEYYILTCEGRTFLGKDPIQQFLCLKSLKSEFNTEFRAFEILEIVGKSDKRGSGSSFGEIARYLREKYGKRGNMKRAIESTLENMINVELLEVIGGTSRRRGHVYRLGRTVKLPWAIEVNPMKEHHTITDFKETVKQIFEECEILNIKKDVKSHIEQILNDLDLCKENPSFRSDEEWIDHVLFLSKHLKDVKSAPWEKRIFSCIIGCILSRLLPSEVSVGILEDYPPPSAPSKRLHYYYSGIAREYYFNLTEIYLNIRKNEEAFQSFSHLEPLHWESFEFLILKGNVRMMKYDMSSRSDVREVLEPFERALKISKGKERVIALFHMGLAYYQRGDFDKAGKTWKQCLELECTLSQEIIVRHNLGNAYRKSGKLEEARELYEDSIVFAKRSSEREVFKFESLIGLGNVLIDLCYWDETEKTLREVIEECTKKGFLLLTAFAMTNLGILLARKGKLKEALSCHEEAMSLVKREDNPQEYGMVLINVGDTLRQLGRVDEALKTLDDAAELVGRENLVLIQEIDILKAEIYFDTGDIDESWKVIRSVFQKISLGNHRSEAEIQKIQGKIKLQGNEFQKAREYLENSERILKELHLKYELLEVYELLEACYRKLKDEEKEAYYRNARETLNYQIGLSE